MESIWEAVSIYHTSVVDSFQKQGFWAKFAAVGLMLYVSTKLWRRYNRKSIKGEITLITGGASGIGRLVAHRMSKLGSTIVICDVNEKGMADVAQEITSAGGKVHTYKVDLAKRKDIYEFAKKVKQDVGIVDILVNNAGIVSGKSILDPQFNDEKAKLTMKINTEAHFWTVRAFVPDMVARNHGHVVSIASAAGLTGVAGLADYCASKFGAVGFDESLRLEFKKKGLTGCTTTCVMPYYINTGMFEGVRTRFSFLLPILEPDYVADQIVQGILENSNAVHLPTIVNLNHFTKFFFPTWFCDALADFLGLNNTMDEFVGRK